jgi:hypothetical protein
MSEEERAAVLFTTHVLKASPHRGTQQQQQQLTSTIF